MKMLCKPKAIIRELCKPNTLIPCIFPALTTLLIFAAVLFVKGIFPFGPNLIDYYDMGQTNAPLYYHIWDFLHGRSALFFDWYINGGQNLAMGSAIQWNISPFNLFFLIIPRNLVYPALSVFIGLHLVFMSFNMGIFLKYSFPELPGEIFYISALAYGLCGFTLTHYTIPTYLDTAAFLPIFALALLRLLRDRGKLMYVFLLAFMTALSYYLGFMHLIYVLLFSGVYIILMHPEKEKRRKIISDLAFGTISGLFMSTFMLLPSVMQMTLSSRFNSNLSGSPFETIISILNSVGADEYYVKYLQLYAMEFFVILVVIGLIRFRKEWRYALTVVSVVLLPCALIVFESINILWHFGTYYHYPIRCGYLIPFAIIAAAASLTEKARKEKTADNPGKVDIKSLLISVLLSAAGLVILVKIYETKAPWDIKVLFRYSAVLWTGLCVMLTVILLYFFFISKKRGKHLIRSITFVFLPVMMAELILGAYIGYGLPKFTDSFFGDPEQSGEYITKAEAFISTEGDRFGKADSRYRIERLKNPDTELNTNYGMVIRHATVTGWANTATGEQIKCAEKLGYSTHFMRILDSGGTFLTDSVLQVKDTVSVSDGGSYKLYHNDMSLPFAMAVSHDLEGEDPTKNGITENNNMLYHFLSGNEDMIAEKIMVSELKASGISEKIKMLKISGRKALYLSKGSADEIRVNGSIIPVPTIGDPENRAFPAWFNSNLLFLGTFEDENVELECPEKSRIITFDIDKMSELSKLLDKSEENAGHGIPEAGKSGLSFIITGTKDRDRALIPISFSPGWSACVNGKKQNIRDFGGMFMLLPISEGENRVEMNFTPPGLFPGILISLITLIATLSLVYIKQFNAFALSLYMPLEPLLYYLYYFIFIVAAAAFYVIPVFWCIIRIIIRHIG